MISAIKTAQAQKHNYADLLMIPLNRLPEFISAGVLANMNALPYTDFSSDIYYSKVVASTSCGEQVWAVCGDGCFDPSHLYTLYYNKTALTAAGIEDITKTAEQKKLTWDYILSCAQKAREAGFAGSALCGKGYSSVTDVTYLSSGYNYVGHSTAGNVPVVMPFTENGQSELQTLNKILSQYGGYFENDAYAKFVSGSSLFCIAPVSALSEINRKGLDFGILPMPLAYEGAPQSSLIDDRTYVICLPVTANDISLSGAALQGFMAASYGYMNEDYYSYLILHLIRSSRDLDMIDLARGGCGNPAVNYDFSLVFDNAPVNSATRNLASEAVFYGGIIADNYRQREYAANRSLYDLYR